MSGKRKKKEAKRAARKDAARHKRDARVHRDAQGRTHLLLHRDAHGRIVGLSLSQPLFNDHWQNDVALAAANSAHGFLADGDTLDQVVALGRNAMAGTSKIADGVLALSPDTPPACHAGCSHCCYQPVGVLPPEVFAIYDHLRSALSADALASTAQRIRDADDRTRGMTAAQRLSPDHPCPFLEADRCTIYDVRPLACRGTNSLDADACERALRDPDARAEFLAGALPLPCFVEPIRAFHAVTAGMQLALADLHDLQASPLELTAAMRIMVDAPETAPAQWLAGADPFEAARGGDNTNNPSIRELSGRRP